MSPSSDAAESVRTFATRFVDGSFADAADILDEDGREAVVETFPDEFREGPMTAEDALERYWRGLYGQYGSATGVTEVSVNGGDATVVLEFEDGTETAHVERGDDGVTGFSFAPEYEPPDYADESTFSERSVTVDAGDVDLDGVLAVPEESGPFPGVLLVHGAGLHDPDGTVGASKILRDLAWGLAAEGIASLRYEKRLADHEVADEDYTVDAVVTDDAVAAVDELAATTEVDGDAVFVAGHSQGGMCAPRIAARHGGVAGVVVLDGPADPILDPDDADFLRYTIEPDGNLSEEQESQLESQCEAIRRIAEDDFDDDETIMGKPGTWHRSTRDCDPLGTVGNLGRPAFVLKTSRADAELQPELAERLRDGYETWEAADLPGGSRVEFYEGLGHYFQAGPTPVTMQSLYFGGNVDEGVVGDVVAWLDDVSSQ